MRLAIEDVVHPARMVSIVTANVKGATMLLAIAAILVVLWVLGLLTSYTMGGFIHVLLVIAIIVVLYNVFAGRKAL
jgi:hypothetical protein